MKTLFVLAHSKDEYYAFARSMESITFYRLVYLYRPDQVANVSSVYTLVGTWYKRNNLGKIMKELHKAEVKFIPASVFIPLAHTYWEHAEGIGG